MLAVELEMISPDGYGVILELVTPAQGRINHQHLHQDGYAADACGTEHHAAL